MQEFDICIELTRSYSEILNYISGISTDDKESIEELCMLNGLLRDILNAMSFYFEDD